jgi:TRAP-type C4-dicarboxylate transport system permease small subunit
MSTKEIASDVPNSRARTITAILFALLAVMVVMDIFARWRGSSTPSQPNVTQRYR